MNVDVFSNTISLNFVTTSDLLYVYVLLLRSPQSSHPQRKAQQTYQELNAKERLLKQQNSVRESVQRKQSGGSAGEPLREGWKEIKDPKTGSTYYWNKVLHCVAEHHCSPPPPHTHTYLASADCLPLPLPSTQTLLCERNHGRQTPDPL